MNDIEHDKLIDSHCPDILPIITAPMSCLVRRSTSLVLLFLSGVLLYLIGYVGSQNFFMVFKESISIKEKHYSDSVNEDYYKIPFPFEKEDILDITVRFDNIINIERLRGAIVNLIIYDPSDWGIPSTINTTILLEQIEYNKLFHINKSISLTSPSPIIVWRNVSSTDHIIIPAAMVEIVLRKRPNNTNILQLIKEKI